MTFAPKILDDDDDDDNNNNNNKHYHHQLWLGHIHLTWDVIINRIRLGGLICSLKSFLQLNMCQELQNFAVVYRVSQEECARLRESVPYVKLYRYNPKHLCPK